MQVKPLANEYNIPVEEPTQEDTGPNIPVETPSPPVSPATAGDRATKAVFGLQNKVNVDYNGYYSSFLQGQEKNVRQYVSDKLAEASAARKVDQIRQLAQAGWPLTKEDVDNVNTAVNDPRSVIEDHYSQRYMDHLNWPKGNPDNTSWLNAIHPEEADTQTNWDKDINLGSEYMARVQFLKLRQQEAAEDSDKQSWLSWSWDQAKNLTTIYPWIKMHTGGSWYDLPGHAQEATRTDLLTLPSYEAFKNKYDLISSSLPPGLRLQFATNMVGMSTSDQVMQDIFPLVQPGVEVSLGVGLISKSVQQNTINTAIRQQIQSSAIQAGMSPTQAATLASGNLAGSAAQRAWGTLANLARRSDPIVEAEKNLPNILRRGRADAILNNGGDVNGTNAILEEYTRMEQELPGILKGLTYPERFPALAEKDPEAIAAALQTVRSRSRDISDNFLNQSNPYQHPIDRSWWSDAIIGRSAVDPFGTAAEAGKWAKDRGLSGYEIVGNKINKVSPSRLTPAEAQAAFDIHKDQFIPGSTEIRIEGEGVRVEQGGTGFYIIKPFPIPEDAPAMRPFYARLPEDKVPEGGVINSLLARWRTPNETQSAWSNRNRESATFVNSVIENYAWKEAEAIRDMVPGFIGKQKWNDWERVLNAARKQYDPDNNRIGYTYKNIGELEYAYRKTVGRSPDNQEIAAYFAFKRINEFDHILRTVSILKHKQRLGVMSHQITWRDPKLQGNVVQSAEFDAIPSDHFPSGNRTIAIIERDGSVTVKRLNALGNHQASGPGTKAFPKSQYYADQVMQGKYTVVKLHAPEHTPLAGYGGIKDTDIIEHVLAPSYMFSNKPIAWGAQLPERGGGHFVYKAPWRISQLDVRPETIGSRVVHKLVGVTSGWHVMNTADGAKIEGLLNQVRGLLKTDRAAARNIVENQLGMNWDEFLGFFKPPPSRNSFGQWTKGTKPRFNINEPFVLHGANENLLNKIPESDLKARYKNFEDIRSTSPNQRFMTEFSQERDANEMFTWDNIGTADAPMYRYEPSPLIDAIPTMNRAMNKISNTLAMDDMKISAVSSWIQEAKNLLTVKEDMLNASPLYWFHHANFIKSPLDSRRIAELEVAREQIKQFIGQVSETDAVIGYWTQKLADALYQSTIPGVSRLAKRIDPVNLAHTLSDPTRFIRAMTFHMKMGLFAIPQILVQGQTYVNILGIAGPVRASQGTVGALMHQWSRMNANPRILAALGKNAEKFGYRPGEWEAFREAGFSTGFFNVGSEYALRDNPMSNKIIQTQWGKFLQLGALPFTEGERNARFGSWYTAAKEMAEIKPVSQWTNADRLKVLNRAALLNGNMNRASNAMFQRGFAALPAQFLTYTIRQAELMWGKRLTSPEKARLLLTNAMAYGLPVGLGITGIPSDFFRNAAIEQGYNPGDNYLNTMITEGIPSTILALVDHDRYWNVGERFGNTGLNDMFYGDKTIWDLAGGAAFSSVGSFLEAFDPFRQAIMSGYRQDGNQFNISYQHLLQPLREITTFNAAERAIAAAKTGTWISKGDNPLLRGVTVPESVMSFLTGLQPQEVSDLRHVTDIKAAEQNVEKWAQSRAIQEAGRAMEAYDNKDTAQGEDFMTNAMMYLNVYIPEERKEEVLSRMFNRFQDVVQRTRQQFGTKDVPPWLKDQRTDQWISTLRNR